MSLSKPFFIIVFLCCGIVYSCKKGKTDPPPASPAVTDYDFTYSGVTIVGDTIHFAGNAATGSTYLWDFGDSTTTNEATPNHTFSHTGSFVVSMTINGDAAHVVKKTIKIYDDPVYTHLIAGIRNWHHTYTTTIYGPPLRDTTYIYPDTSFAITYIDPLTVTIGTDTLFYTTTSDSILSFYHDLIAPSNSEDDVQFNYLSNTVKFTLFRHYGAADNTTQTYTTY